MKAKKTDEAAMLTRFGVGKIALSPLVVRKLSIEGVVRDIGVDARLELGAPGSSDSFFFDVECKSRSTPETIQLAMTKAKSAAAISGAWPMIQVPFLSPQHLELLEMERVSGIDLCGNGIVIVPGRLYVVRTGKPNQYPDSRPLSNPYRMDSAMVARLLLDHPHWNSLTELATAVGAAGAKLSLSQVSKAVHALSEELIVIKNAGTIRMIDPLRLLDKLGQNWKKPQNSTRRAIRMPPGRGWAQALSSHQSLRWAVTGESSAGHYAMFSQGGPLRLAVSDAELATQLLNGKPELIPNFADLELIESDALDFYFANEIDENGMRWASRLQTWLELQSGDARQQDAARDIRKQLLENVKV